MPARRKCLGIAGRRAALRRTPAVLHATSAALCCVSGSALISSILERCWMSSRTAESSTCCGGCPSPAGAVSRGQRQDPALRAAMRTKALRQLSCRAALARAVPLRRAGRTMPPTLLRCRPPAPMPAARCAASSRRCRERCGSSAAARARATARSESSVLRCCIRALWCLSASLCQRVKCCPCSVIAVRQSPLWPPVAPALPRMAQIKHQRGRREGLRRMQKKKAPQWQSSLRALSHLCRGGEEGGKGGARRRFKGRRRCRRSAVGRARGRKAELGRRAHHDALRACTPASAWAGLQRGDLQRNSACERARGHHTRGQLRSTDAAFSIRTAAACRRLRMVTGGCRTAATALPNHSMAESAL
jgi:hypothetical protein